MHYDRASMKLLVCSILLLSLILPGISLAQEDSVDKTTPPTVDYTLPYPGILPNNPLYVIKMIRDRIILLIITDSRKKAEFNLLQADKRIEAAVFLINEDKEKNSKLALTTIEKGENYYHDAVVGAISLEEQGVDMGSFLHTLDLAADKHIFILTNLESVIPREKAELLRLKARIQSYQLQIKD